jgi:hypothetical protein
MELELELELELGLGEAKTGTPFTMSAGCGSGSELRDGGTISKALSARAWCRGGRRKKARNAKTDRLDNGKRDAKGKRGAAPARGEKTGEARCTDACFGRRGAIADILPDRRGEVNTPTQNAQMCRINRETRYIWVHPIRTQRGPSNQPGARAARKYIGVNAIR